MYAVKLIDKVKAVTIPGVKGNGKTINDDTQHKATHIEIFVSSFTLKFFCKKNSSQLFLEGLYKNLLSTSIFLQSKFIKNISFNIKASQS